MSPEQIIEKVTENKFKREDRYLIFKWKDIQHLSPNDKERLMKVCHGIELVRRARQVGPVEAVVVEKDWPEYHLVWNMIEARVGAENARS